MIITNKWSDPPDNPVMKELEEAVIGFLVLEREMESQQEHGEIDIEKLLRLVRFRLNEHAGMVSKVLGAKEYSAGIDATKEWADQLAKRVRESGITLTEPMVRLDRLTESVRQCLIDLGVNIETRFLNASLKQCHEDCNAKSKALRSCQETSTKELEKHRKERDELQATVDSLRKEVARLSAENHAYSDEDGTTWTRPTAEAYRHTCIALHAKERELAEATRLASAQSSELEDYAKTTVRLNKEVRELKITIRRMEDEATKLKIHLELRSREIARLTQKLKDRILEKS